MIKTIQAKNFKPWESLPRTEFAQITGLFGANSSGKSAILQLLLLMKQTVESTDPSQVLNFGDDRSPVMLGGFRDVVFAHKTGKEMEWSVDWSRPSPLSVSDPRNVNRELFSSRDFRFETELHYRRRRVQVARLAYTFDGVTFSMGPDSRGREGYELHASPESSFRFRRTRGRAWPLPPPLRFYGFPDQVKAYYQNAAFLADFELSFEEMLRSTYYLGPLRDVPQRVYTWTGAQPVDVGYRGEKAVDALLASRAARTKISRGQGIPRLTLQQYVAKWLRDLNLIHSFSVSSIERGRGKGLYEVRVRRTTRTPEVLLTDVGFGVSQVLPILVLLYYAPRGSTILLEQPELHLHPAIQAALANVFLDAMRKRRVQIVFESHSEHLLNRLQLLLAQDKLLPTETALLFVAAADKGSTIERLDLDIFGNISNWPRDFFGDPLHESARRLEAEHLRRSKSSS